MRLSMQCDLSGARARSAERAWCLIPFSQLNPAAITAKHEAFIATRRTVLLLLLQRGVVCCHRRERNPKCRAGPQHRVIREELQGVRMGLPSERKMRHVDVERQVEALFQRH